MNGGGVYNSVNVLPPRPTIARSDERGALVARHAVFPLQRTNVLPATNTWQILTNQPTLNSSNLQYQITVPLPATSNNFYRLFSSPVWTGRRRTAAFRNISGGQARLVLVAKNPVGTPIGIASGHPIGASRRFCRRSPR